MAKGGFTEQLLVKLDEEIVAGAERKLKESEKTRRRQRRRRRKGIEEQNLEDEGTTYAAGEFLTHR